MAKGENLVLHLKGLSLRFYLNFWHFDLKQNFNDPPQPNHEQMV